MTRPIDTLETLRSGVRQLAAACGLCCFGGVAVMAQSASPDERAEQFRGYVARYLPGHGAALVIRGDRQLGVTTGMTIHRNDRIEVQGDAELELRLPERPVVLNAVRPTFAVREGPVAIGPRTVSLMESFHSLLVKMPAGFAHSESKGSADCAQEARAAMAAPVDLRPAAALSHAEQVLRTDMRRVSLAWIGGLPPFRISIERPPTEAQVGVFCQQAVDLLDLGDGSSPGPSTLTVKDAAGRSISWTLNRVDANAFASRQLRAKVDAVDDDPIATAIGNLRAVDPALHLVGYTVLTQSSSENFIAWRLSIAARTEEQGF